MNGCGKCSLAVGGVHLHEYIRCDGRCDREFHMHCTTLNAFDIRRCLEQENVLWMCDDCLRCFRKQQSDSNDMNKMKQNNESDESCMEATVGQLQSEVSQIKESLANLQTSLSKIHPTTDTLPTTSTPQRSSVSGGNASMHENNRSQLRIGSRTETASSMNSSRKFWLYFTRVAKHVTTDAIREMVCRSLEMTNQPDVVKIVPRWGSMNDWRYVSFKIGVDWSYRETAVAESTWPVGLSFREFVRHESSYWEP